MESNARYFARRAAAERSAARTALTEAARQRRLTLAEQFARRAADCLA